MKVKKKIHKPKWFDERTDANGETEYVYVGGYWESRQKASLTIFLISIKRYYFVCIRFNIYNLVKVIYSIPFIYLCISEFLTFWDITVFELDTSDVIILIVNVNVSHEFIFIW